MNEEYGKIQFSNNLDNSNLLEDNNFNYKYLAAIIFVAVLFIFSSYFLGVISKLIPTFMFRWLSYNTGISDILYIIVSAVAFGQYSWKFFKKEGDGKLKLFWNFFGLVIIYFSVVWFVCFLSTIFYSMDKGSFGRMFLVFEYFSLSALFKPIIMALIFSVILNFSSNLKIVVYKSLAVAIFLPIAYLIIPYISPTGSCELHSGSRACIVKKAIEKNNANLCNLTIDKNNCYIDVFNTNNDEKICSSIKDDVVRNDCYCHTAGICEKDEDILELVGLLLKKWYEKNGENYAGFLDNSENKNTINQIVGHFKQDKGRDAEFRIFTSPTNYSVKVRFGNDSFFYCKENVESLGFKDDLSGQYKIDIKDNNFEMRGFCNGKEYLGYDFDLDVKLFDGNKYVNYQPLNLVGYRNPTPWESSFTDPRKVLFYAYNEKREKTNAYEKFPDEYSLSYTIFDMKKVGDYESIKNKLEEHKKIYDYNYEKIDICGQEADFGYSSREQKDSSSDDVSGELVYVFGTYYHQINAYNNVNTQYFFGYKRNNKDEIRKRVKEDAIKLARLHCEKYNK